MSTPQTQAPSSTTPDTSSSLTMDHTDGSTKKRSSMSDEEDDIIAGWLLMEECWSECGERQQQQSECGNCAVRFISDPYSSLLVFQSSSSYITINGNEETCGSSFSDCGTVSFMATLHSTTPNFTAPIPMHHHENEDEDEDEDEEVLPKFLGLLDHQQEEEDDDLLLPPNSQL